MSSMSELRRSVSGTGSFRNPVGDLLSERSDTSPGPGLGRFLVICMMRTPKEKISSVSDGRVEPSFWGHVHWAAGDLGVSGKHD